MYTAVMIYEEEKSKLLSAIIDRIPPWYEIIADHMTINMQSAADGPCAGRVGEEVLLVVKGFDLDDRVAAVQVETDVPSLNEVKHITVGVNRDGGGKPKHSNELRNWKPIPEFALRGVIREI